MALNIEFKLPKGVEEPEGFNKPFGPLRVATADEFWHQVDAYGFGDKTPPIRYRFAQVYSDYLPGEAPLPARRLISLHYVWFGDHGFAVEVQHESKNENSKFTTTHTPRFYKIGCQHTYKESPAKYNCYHILDCEKCGSHVEYDSSG